jgi:hypothetical protein
MAFANVEGYRPSANPVQADDLEIVRLSRMVRRNHGAYLEARRRLPDRADMTDAEIARHVEPIDAAAERLINLQARSLAARRAKITVLLTTGGFDAGIASSDILSIRLLLSLAQDLADTL